MDASDLRRAELSDGDLNAPISISLKRLKHRQLWYTNLSGLFGRKTLIWSSKAESLVAYELYHKSSSI